MRFLLSLALLLNLLVGCAPQAQQATYLDGNGKSGITGKVFLKQEGQPLSGAYVNVYPNHAPNLLGPSTYISSPTDASGNYRIDVPPGKYFVVARKRLNGMATGPINPGDFFSEDARLLTEIKTGKLTK
ncbi:carboxypeptidase-like regulatory domain-containing protein, partial [Malonomonas rubra]|uniref:carboxypeptidase-like regulatory domain-containing protein n=1 Tax=Malonomonas rubra TaxID=57040 RepID=UPI0026F0D6B0